MTHCYFFATFLLDFALSYFSAAMNRQLLILYLPAAILTYVEGRGVVPYDWEDPTSFAFGWTPFVQGDGDYFFGNNTCVPDYDDAGVMGDYGNCHNPEIGGPNSKWKSCVHVFTDSSKNETDWRCTCHLTMNPRGMNCDYEGEPGESFRNSGIFFLAISLLFFVDACFALKLCVQMLQLKGWKFNAAITSNCLVTGGLCCEAFRHSLYIFRNEPVGSGWEMDAQAFDVGLFTLPLTIIFTCQGMLGLSLTWIGIAEKSGNVKNAKRKLIILRSFLYVYMIVLTAICFFLAATNNSVAMSFVGLASMITVVPCMGIASSKLRRLLSAGAPPKAGQFDISTCLQTTTRKLLICCPIFLFAILWFVGANTAINQRGIPERNNVPIYSLTLTGFSLWFLLHSIKSFFVESNKGSLAKFRKNKVSVTTMYGNSSAASGTSSAEVTEAEA